ncbi:MAG: DUF3108 domain-containing protein [Opitutaceae bacterium]
MKRTLALAACAALALAASAPTRADGPPIGDNERLVYRVSWAIFPAAGRITVYGQAMNDAAGAPLFSVVTETQTRNIVKLILPFAAHAESLYDGRTGRLVSYAEWSRMRQRDSYHTMRFDYADRTVAYDDRSKPGSTRILRLPPGDPMDLINGLLSARRWHLRPGQTHDILVFFEGSFYSLTVHAVGEETLNTPLGTFRTVVLEPRMDKGPPRGMFRRGGTVRVWIAEDDPRRLPVQFQVRFKFGTGLATLIEYQPAEAVASGGRGRVLADRK